MVDLPSAHEIATTLWPGARREKDDTSNTRCPCHDDHQASLAVTVRDGKLLVHCFAGCPQAAVYAEVRRICGLDDATRGPRPPAKPPAKRRKRAAGGKGEVVTPVPDDAPPPTDHIAGFGRAAKVWEYRDAEGRLCFRVARFETPEGKRIRPQSLVRRGSRLGWEWRACDAPRPLLGLQELLAAPPEMPVLIVAGEKCFDAARLHFGHRFVPITWSNGENAMAGADWAPVDGRHGLIWPDADTAGMRAAEAILQLLDEETRARFQVLPWPPKVKKGFDIADAVDVWPLTRLEAHLRGEIPEETASSEPVSVMPLGVTEGRYAYWSDRLRTVVLASASELAVETHLLGLLPLDELRDCFPGDERRAYSATAAREWLVGQAAQAGVFDPSMVRGRGVWREPGGPVVHAGNVIHDGPRTHLPGIRDGRAYIQRLPLDLEHAHVTDRDAQAIVDLCDAFLWSEAIDGKILAGWIALAPLAGWLRWRPSIWISGASGSGKTWVIERVVYRLLGPWVIRSQSSNTEAGLRQELGADALPIVFDEAEGDNQVAQERIARIMELARVAATEGGGKIYKGTTAHRPVTFSPRTMFCFGSVGAHMARQADESRITLIELRVDLGGRNLARVLAEAEKIRAVTAGGLVRRMVARADALGHNIGALSAAVTEVCGTAREGQQLGTLIAGAFTLVHDRRLPVSQARQIVEKYGLAASAKRSEMTDQQRCLERILAIRRRIDDVPRGGVTRTVSELLHVARGDGDPVEGLTGDVARRDLARLGLKLDEADDLLVQNNSPQLADALAGTPYAGNWRQYLMRLSGADTYGNVSVKLDMRVSKVVRVPLDWPAD